MANQYIHAAEFAEQGTTPTTPAAGNRKIYPKADGWYDLDDAGTETVLGSGSSNIGAGVIKTIATGVVTTGTDRNIIVAAESGTTDDLIEVSGLSVGDFVYLRADTGDTITVQHNDVGATNKIHLIGDVDFILNEQNALTLLQADTNVLVQIALPTFDQLATFDDISPLTTKGDVLTRDASTNTRLAVGTDGQVLTADSAQATGIKWATPSSSSGFGASSTKTIASGVVSAGSDRNLIIAAETGTTDDLIELTGLSVGELVFLRGDVTDTITVKANDAGATVKFYTIGLEDFTLPVETSVPFLLQTTNILVQLGNPDFSQISPLTATGGLISRTSSGNDAQLTVGTDGQVLTADSAQAFGIKWATVGNLGAGVIKTLSTDALAVGTDRNVIVAAESGTSDTLIAISSGMNVGDIIYLRADTGDTITVSHNDAGASNKIHLVGNTNFTLDEQNPLVLLQADTNVMVQLSWPSLTQISPMTTKGDLISTASSIPARLAVGSNGQILMADSAETLGLKWMGGAWTILDSDLEISSSTASFSITSIPTTYDEWRLTMILRGTNVSDTVNVRVRLNANTTASNYSAQFLSASSTTVAGGRDTTNATICNTFAPGANVAVNTFAVIRCHILNVSDTAKYKVAHFEQSTHGATTQTAQTVIGHGYFIVATATSQIDIVPSAGNWAAGSGYILEGRNYA